MNEKTFEFSVDQKITKNCRALCYTWDVQQKLQKGPQIQTALDEKRKAILNC